jgi:hypothetical protein
MIYIARYVTFVMFADPLRGQIGGGWAQEIETFLGPEMATSELISIWAQKSLDLQGPTPAICPSNGFARIKNITYRTVQSIDAWVVLCALASKAHSSHR